MINGLIRLIMRRWLLLLLLTPPLCSYSQKSIQIPPVPPDSAQVIFYRKPGFESFASAMDVLMNGLTIAKVKNKDWVEFITSPGAYQLQGYWYNPRGNWYSESVGLNLQNRKRYFILIDGRTAIQPFRILNEGSFLAEVKKIDNRFVVNQRSFKEEKLTGAADDPFDQFFKGDEVEENVSKDHKYLIDEVPPDEPDYNYQQQDQTGLPTYDQVRSDEPVEIEDSDIYGTTLVEEISQRKYHALIIAVQDYLDPAITDLQQPVQDATALARVLSESYNFAPGDILFLKNASRNQIIEAFDHLSNSVHDKDNLLIFYAGHGIWDDRMEQGFWLPNDARKNSKAQWLSNSTIRDYIKAIDSRHTLLISDACFSGGIFLEREAFSESKAMVYLYKHPSRKAMTSGSLNTVPDRSVFMQYLLKSLQNNSDPLISAEQLFADFKVAVINNSPNNQVPQYGVIRQADDEGGDFIFLRKMK